MKSALKVTCFIAFLCVGTSLQSAFAQTKADIFDPKTPITLLGMDFSLTKFIGSANNTTVGVNPFGIVHTKDEGKVTNEDFKNNYTLAWNQLFIDETKKYNVAKAVHRESINYALDVTEKANKAIKKDLFSENPGDFKTLTEANITTAVKNYDFGKNQGIGLIFFVEGMSKGMEKEGIWVTFVDMKSKTVLLTVYKENKPGGFGFRNYWAKPIYTLLKDMDSDFKKWNK